MSSSPRISTDANKVEAVRVERVTDDMFAGYEGKLYHVSMKHKVDLSPELRGRTGVWAADPIVKGSAAINTLVKFAATYLRFVQDEAAKTWLPAAGTFDSWPETANLIRLLDPCMGSGHFLVFSLPLLVRLRMEEESPLTCPLSAGDSVLRSYAVPHHIPILGGRLAVTLVLLEVL